MQTEARAIVIGGSLAGLWTARVLADHFEQVTVLERDQLPTGAESRAGVPQDKHVHVLLERGAQIMSQLFPGITDELLAAGANRIDLTQNCLVKARGQWLPQFQSGIITYACSRLLLESILRKRVAALPNVELCGGAQVQGLVAQNGAVEGVRVKWKDGREDGVETAVFIVDASGRSSKLPDWLPEIGYAAPEETVIDVRLGYAGRRYKIPGPAPEWDTMLIGVEPPHQSRAGLIYSEENGIWMVMLAGILGDYPPTDEAGFLDFALDMEPEFHAAIQNVEPISNIIGYRRTENRLRHYEKLTRWPDRLVALGDAVCGFNPVYGQGMTVSAMAAVTLGEMLGASGGKISGIAQSFQKKYPKIVEPAWLLATSADLEWLGNEEATSFPEKFASRYMPKLLDTIPSDQTVHKMFIQVQNLIVPPTSLFVPKIAWRVFRHKLRFNS
ncbi:MAG: FAD-dependent monooxygenase [Ardenticatenaceae bacterium]|nr:FAD-dependent monooxygenase [Ardenticatenaceae bacterium]MCB8949667.1 FAD-dependent monooxygenase [Ardenticatenaceae bacterium]